MGKLTSKKKSTSKKKTTEKKTTAKAKTTTKAKTPAKAVSASKAGKKTEATAKKASEKATKISVKDLVLKKFETTEPEKLFSVKPDENYQKNFSAPEFVDTTDEKEAKRIKALLSEKFDIKAFPVKAEKKPAPTEKKQTPENQVSPAKPAAKKKVPVKDLILKKFETQAPEKLFSVKPDENYQKKFSAPAFFELENEEEAKKIRALLSMEFDIKAFPEKREEKAPEKPVVAEKEIKKEPEPAKKEAKPEPHASNQERMPITDKKGTEPMDATVKGMLAICIAVILTLIISSYSNNTDYYMVNKKGAMEIQQGRFAPAGRQVLVTLPDMNAPEPVKNKYSKEEVFPYIVKYYTEKADAVINASAMPDLDKVRSYLDKALSFAVTDESRNAVNARYKDIDLMMLLYKADIAASKGKKADYETALKYLNDAGQLKLETSQAKLVEEKIKLIKNLMD